tara:strand:+ start:205 stop:585 length:381 start_codon:yes stop_codon:yes gene_type:complete
MAKTKAKGHQQESRLSADDLFVRRNKEGDLMPIEVKVPGFDGKTIKVLPTTLGSVKGLTSLDEDAVQWPLAEKLRYVTEHVVDPDMRSLSIDDAMDALTVWDLDMILIAAVQAGGPQRRQYQEKKA